jgi:hypothetical protein
VRECARGATVPAIVAPRGRFVRFNAMFGGSLWTLSDVSGSNRSGPHSVRDHRSLPEACYGAYSVGQPCVEGCRDSGTCGSDLAVNAPLHASWRSLSALLPST